MRSVLFLQILFEGTGVHADTDRDVMCSGAGNKFLNPFPSADIAGIEPDLVDPVLDRRDCETVVKMDIGNDRNVHGPPDRLDRLRAIHIVNSKADDVASCPFKRQDLRDGAFNILRVGVGHGLDQDGIPVPDLSVSDSDFSRFHCKRFPLIRLEMSLYVRNTIRPIRRIKPIM